MDVKNVFLNRNLHEEVYMIPSPSVSYKSSEVYKLQKALIGLKQTLCLVLEVFYNNGLSWFCC